MENFKLDKTIWTQKDFWDMRWHDASLHGWAIERKDIHESDLLLDIDYIFAWIQPVPPSEYLSYWIAPCTIIFNNVSSFHIYFDEDGYLEMNIGDIYMQQKSMEEMNIFNYSWKIDLLHGQMKFLSDGFTQIARKQPMHIFPGQKIPFRDKEGINFSRVPCAI